MNTELTKTARGYEYLGYEIIRKTNGEMKFYIRYMNKRLNEMATVYFKTLAQAKTWVFERNN